ncbi:MAG TPA: pyridoxal kinase [Bauldia sp.]|nr:pyridoxal kinase [Bauldia sp.]
MPKPAVIAVNSHVARGSVGGRASVFALQRMGFPVWSVPTVLLPWHLGHGRASRIAPDNALFEALVADIAGAKWLSEVGGMLSGYFGSVDQVASVADLAAAVKARNPGGLFLCDPILGDSHGRFQPEALVTAIRDRLMPVADIATPNRYELAWLTGMRIDSNDRLVAAARALGPREVVVTSALANPGKFGALVVTRDEAHLVFHREIENAPHGTGDLFAALYLGHRLKGAIPSDAMGRAVSAVVRLLEIARDANADEMPLAEGQDAFAAPPLAEIVVAPFR